jgi:hypothetical protein
VLTNVVEMKLVYIYIPSPGLIAMASRKSAIITIATIMIHAFQKKLWVVLPVSLLVMAVVLIPYTESLNAKTTTRVDDAPLVVSGSNVYTVWPNGTSNLHSVPIFFTKSTDGGKTFAHTMIISSPNTNPKTFVVNVNVSIGASGNNIAVTWWTNKTGIFNPVIRTSSDGGNTFANIIRLNSTAGGINK